MDIMNVEEYKTWIGGIARRFNPTFHVYHNFRLKNFYILEKQPIIVEFLADFVSRGSVVKTEQKPTVGRSFDNNSRERGKSGYASHLARIIRFPHDRRQGG